MVLPPRFNVLGVGVHALDLPTATTQLVAAAPRHERRLVCCCDAHSVLHARRDPAHRRTLNHAYLATPDGMPLVWLGRRAGYPTTDRVYGPDLLQAVARATAGTPLSHFFYGGTPGVAAALAARLTRDHPGLRVAGAFSPPQDVATALPFAVLRDAAPDFVWVGLGTPKQEAFMAHLATAPDVPFGIAAGVGAAFDFLTGRARQAPPRVRALGLEWLWRLAHEPRRLGRRYLVTVPGFTVRVAAQILGLRRYPWADSPAR